MYKIFQLYLFSKRMFIYMYLYVHRFTQHMQQQIQCRQYINKFLYTVNRINKAMAPIILYLHYGKDQITLSIYIIKVIPGHAPPLD